MTIFELARDFQEGRRTLNENNADPKVVFDLLLGEVEELREELDLLIQGKSSPEKAGREVSDIVLFCLSLYRALKIDPETELKEKIARNHLKHPAYRFNNGIAFSEAIRLDREEWTDERESDYYAYCLPSRSAV